MNEVNLPAQTPASAEPNRDACATGQPSAPLNDRKQRVVVVLGMHRSGTSLLANLLTTLGVDLGGDLLGADANNQAGYWEHQAINRTQDVLLHKLGKRWGGHAWMNPFPLDWEQLPESERNQAIQELSGIVSEEISKAKGIWGFKDPRTSRLWPLWKEIFARLNVEPLCLLALRHPAGVVESLAKRDQMPASQAEMLWLLHNLDAVRDSGDQLRLVVDYDQWFQRPGEQAHAIADALGLTWPAAADQLVADLRQRIRPDLRHCDSHKPLLLPFMEEVHGVLKHAAETGGKPDELRRLDAEVRRAMTLCDPWIEPAKESKASSAEAGKTTPESTPGESNPAPLQIEFDEGRYLALYPDVAEAVRDGRCKSGWHHFLSSGGSEGRRWFRLSSDGTVANAGKQSAANQTSRGRAGLQQLQKNWDLLGKVDPLWAILSDPAKKNNGWDSGEFFSSGEPIIRENVAYARKLQPSMGATRALDFGCGVGRLTQALCQHFERCDGVDIAPSMIQQAGSYNQHGGRCQYHLNGRDDLSLFPDQSFDFISCFIVLQHIRPEFSHRYIQEFVRVLKPNGVLVFQLPGDRNKLLTGERNADAGGLDSSQAAARPESLIEMHGLAKSEVLQLLETSGGRALEVRADGLAGQDAESYTYYVTRDAKPAVSSVAAPQPDTNDCAICTIVSKNYLSQARTFARSVRRQHPGAKVFVLLVDEIEGCFDPAKEPFETVTVDVLKKIPNTPHLFFKYDVMELNTAVKPCFLRYLFEQRGFKKVLYFDPDILVLHRLDHLWSLLEKNLMLLTPHIMEPYEDALHPNEIEINQSGIFNLGFIGLSDRPGLTKFLSWWERRLYDFCASDVARGLFTDQRWINFAPVMFDGVHVIKEPTHNVAYWNLNSRAAHLKCVDGQWLHDDKPVVFFHFSGFDAKNIEPISKHQNRFRLSDLPHLRPLFEHYRDQLMENGQTETSAWRYAFDFFRNGVRIPPHARKIYRELSMNHFFGDPFDTGLFGSFFRWLNEDFTPNGAKEPLPVSNLLVHIYAARPDLQQAYPDITGKNARAWKEWLHKAGCKDFKLDPVFLPQAETSARPAPSAVPARKPARASLPFGMNVAGFFTGEFGNAETARSNVRALQLAGVPHALNNISYALHSQNDRQFTDFSAENPHAVNLVHVNADTTPVFRIIAGRGYFEGRHNIGLWWWELERFPDRWKSHFETYQEIWTQSTFCQKSIARISPVPVTMIPHVVHVDEKSLVAGSRDRLGIPRDSFVFLFSFDYLSYMERKNPLAVIESFRRAFGSRQDALLVIKSVNGHHDQLNAKRIAAATAGLNVHFIADHLSRLEMLSLIAESDCYVSLHRSEGFGQGMAEAMYLRKPVIATNYSGNTDFMTGENSFPVRYKLVELEKNHGPYEKGNHWAQPDIDHAAEQMQLVWHDRELAANKARRAAQDIRAKHSLDVVADLMAKRLRQITGVRDVAQSSPNIAASAPIPVSSNGAGIRVSVIIPTFNKRELTEKCLEKIAANTPPGLCEIIVVDNGSSDGTVALLEQQRRNGVLKPLFNSTNQGFARACNQGAKAARGEYLLFLNNDTEPQPGWLTPLLAIADADPRVAAVGGKLLYPDGTIQHAGIALAELTDKDPLLATNLFAREKSDHAPANQRQVCQAVTAACLLARKSAFDAVGGFDDEYWNGYEDVDLCLQFQERGWLNVYEPASVVIHHESKSGPERFRCAQQNIARLHKKWLDKAQPDILIDAAGKLSAAPAPRLKSYTGPAGDKVSIIILAHNQLEHTRLCLESIRAHTSLPHELILVDNASTDGTSEFFRSLAAQKSNVTVITNRRNLGFAAGNNHGLAIAHGNFVLLLNNDTVVTEGSLEKMLAALQRHPDTGIVGPMSNYVAGPQLVKDVPYTDLAGMPAFAAEWSRDHACQSQEIGRVVGFCLLARRSVIDRIGGLDEQFGSGNFEDDDFCLRAGFAGFRICIAQDAFIHHTGSRTFIGAKIDYRESMLRNWKLFKTKWGMDKDAPIEQGYSVPASLPPTAALKFPLPENKATSHSTAPAAAKSSKPAKAAPLVLPSCALLGRLSDARDLLKKKQLEPAWKATLAAIQSRPFHPEAFLLLAEIAQAAGDSVSARQCAQHARNIAPEWKPARQFLKGNLRGNTKPAWLALPEAVSNPSKSPPRLSVCLIAKNEERFLGRCLASIRELAAQIVVVDTGSSDRTVEIAKKAGAEIHEFAWTDDFSAARNEALKYATGDWILFLDADEELLPAHRETILQEMQAASVMAWRLPIIDQGREAAGRSYVPRLFRNAPALFYVGRVHEQVFTSIEVRRQEWGLENRLGKSALLHHGYTDEVVASRDKIARNLRLLEQAIEELPDEPNLIMSLGLELVRSGRLSEGLERYQEAVELMSALPAAQVVPELRETLLTQYSTHLVSAGRFADIERLCQLPFAKTAPMTASQHFLLGLAMMELKRPAETAEQMRQCLEKRGRSALSPVNPEILKAGPNHCLALSLAAIKDYDAALVAFRAALADDPKSRPARFDLARFQFERGDAVEALKLLNELVAEKPDDEHVWQFGGQIALSRPEFFKFALNWTGEAHKNLPQHTAITLQRAEALLLAQDADAALPLWTTTHSPQSARHLAALVICEAVSGNFERRFAPGEEAVVSRELVKWYQLLLAARANNLLTRLNESMNGLRDVAPSFVKIWEAAANESRRAPVAA